MIGGSDGHGTLFVYLEDRNFADLGKKKGVANGYFFPSCQAEGCSLDARVSESRLGPLVPLCFNGVLAHLSLYIPPGVYNSLQRNGSFSLALSARERMRLLRVERGLTGEENAYYRSFGDRRRLLKEL